ncbi:hypothetical protein [Chitinophaga sp.]|uniref:hypothetical protein n=1 Tax=Chitinophaga sp. TaxID=1869181 RepID=UPI002CEF989C|nr:hypothetical protein [Chitinophaga sp.]HWV67922.1 hypothetical protein [Chitinophaga sp.]
MYQSLTFIHSLFRWLVLISLVYAVYRAGKGYFTGAIFSKTDNLVRHWTATIAHVQLLIGITFYFHSPVIRYFLSNFSTAGKSFDLVFFGMIHSTLMLLSIILITIGSALAKRKATDKEKFKTMLLWYAIALIIIFMAIPWPFSPFAHRPYFR